MRPILWEFDCFDRLFFVPAYGTALLAALVVVVAVGFLTSRLRRLPAWPSLIYMLALVAALPVGSRFLYWAVQDRQGEEKIELWQLQPVGLLLPGGVLAAIGAGWIVSRMERLNAWRMIDTATPALGLAGAVLRLGCFGNGCCFGRETTVPWGVIFPMGSPAHLYQARHNFEALLHAPLPVHPTQLYELAACLIVALLAGWLLWRRSPDGLPTMVAATWLVVFRAVNSQFRAPVAFGPPTWAFDVLCIMILVLFWWAYWKNKDVAVWR